MTGLAFAGAIMMMARFQDSSINHMVELAYRLSQQHDLSATFTELRPARAVHELAALPGVRKVEGIRQVPVRLRHENHSLKTAIEGLRPGSVLRQPIDDRRQTVAIPEGGLVLNDYLARRLGVGVGDTVWVEVLDMVGT